MKIKQGVIGSVLIIAMVMVGCGELSSGGISARSAVHGTITDNDAKLGGLYSAELPNGDVAVIAAGTYAGLDGSFLAAYQVRDGQVFAADRYARDASPGVATLVGGMSSTKLEAAVKANN